MTDPIKLYSLADLEGLAQCGSITLGGLSAITPLPDIPCRFAMLSSWTVTTALARTAKAGATASTKGSGSAGVEIYWGFNNQLFGQLFTGEQTPLLPVNNLRQLCAKGTGELFYAWFV